MNATIYNAVAERAGREGEVKPFYIYVRRVVRASGEIAEEFAFVQPFMHLSNGWRRVLVEESEPVRAKLADRERRIRLAATAYGANEITVMLEALNLRRPLRRKR